MSTVLIDSATAARLTGAQTTVEVRTDDGKLVGTFTPRREATEADYEWAMKQFTPGEIEASRQSGPGRPLANIIVDLRKRYGA